MSQSLNCDWKMESPRLCSVQVAPTAIRGRKWSEDQRQWIFWRLCVAELQQVVRCAVVVPGIYGSLHPGRWHGILAWCERQVSALDCKYLRERKQPAFDRTLASRWTDSFLYNIYYLVLASPRFNMATVRKFPSRTEKAKGSIPSFWTYSWLYALFSNRLCGHVYQRYLSP